MWADKNGQGRDGSVALEGIIISHNKRSSPASLSCFLDRVYCDEHAMRGGGEDAWMVQARDAVAGNDDAPSSHANTSPWASAQGAPPLRSLAAPLPPTMD